MTLSCRRKGDVILSRFSAAGLNLVEIATPRHPFRARFDTTSIAAAAMSEAMQFPMFACASADKPFPPITSGCVDAFEGESWARFRARVSAAVTESPLAREDQQALDRYGQVLM